MCLCCLRLLSDISDAEERCANMFSILISFPWVMNWYYKGKDGRNNVKKKTPSPPPPPAKDDEGKVEEAVDAMEAKAEEIDTKYRGFKKELPEQIVKGSNTTIEGQEDQSLKSLEEIHLPKQPVNLHKLVYINKDQDDAEVDHELVNPVQCHENPELIASVAVNPTDGQFDRGEKERAEITDKPVGVEETDTSVRQGNPRYEETDVQVEPVEHSVIEQVNPGTLLVTESANKQVNLGECRLAEQVNTDEFAVTKETNKQVHACQEPNTRAVLSTTAGTHVHRNDSQEANNISEFASGEGDVKVNSETEVVSTGNLSSCEQNIDDKSTLLVIGMDDDRILPKKPLMKSIFGHKTKKKAPQSDEDLPSPKPSGYNLDHLDDPEDTSPSPSTSTPHKGRSSGGYNLDFLDNLEDLENATPPVFPKGNKMPPPSLPLEPEPSRAYPDDDGDSGFVGQESKSPDLTEESRRSPSPPPLENVSRKLSSPDFEQNEKWLLEGELDKLQANKISDLDLEMDELMFKRNAMEENHANMMQVVSQYEKTISELVSGREREKIWREIDLEKLRNSGAEALEDLHLAESAFENVNKKFERLRDVIGDLQGNEDSLQISVQKAQEQIKINNERYEHLRKHAEEKLRQATDEVQRKKTGDEANISKLKAMLRRAEMKVNSLEETLEHKTKENMELCQIVDELIGRVGSR